MRLVCEPAAVPSAELQDDEKLLLQLFGQGSAKDKSSKAGKFSYVYAENLGRRGDMDACTKTYPACPMPPTKSWLPSVVLRKSFKIRNYKKLGISNL